MKTTLTEKLKKREIQTGEHHQEMDEIQCIWHCKKARVRASWRSLQPILLGEMA